MVVNPRDNIETLAEEIEMKVAGAVQFLIERKNHCRSDKINTYEINEIYNK